MAKFHYNNDFMRREVLIVAFFAVLIDRYAAYFSALYIVKSAGFWLFLCYALR